MWQRSGIFFLDLNNPKGTGFFFVFVFFFFLSFLTFLSFVVVVVAISWAAPAADGGSQARG